MAKNDLVLLDGVIETRTAEALPSPNSDEVFEFFALQELLKDYDLSHDELTTGWIDGRDDGGIDGFFTLVNGHLLSDPDNFIWPKRNASIDVWIVTVKHHPTFQQAPLNSLLASMTELLDLSLEKSQLRGSYSDAVLKSRSLFHLAYRRLSAVRASLTFHFSYVSRGDTLEVASNVRARAAQIVGLANSHFSSCDARFHFVGASELVDLYRRVKTFSLELPFIEYLARSKDSYVLLTRLDDYCNFVTDDRHLRRYLFDSNVRDYLGENRVNEDIVESLRDPSAPDFWWLNNGVTILATSATVLGKTIQLQDVQIVNGLQTTESIFRHFEAGDLLSAPKAILVKVIISSDAEVRDRIIRATNNQSNVELSALHATDKIQRDIEEVLEREGWFYERRKNYFRNIGKPENRFVTPMYIAAGYLALIFKNPVAAAALKSKFMRNPISYAAVFSEEAPLAIWPIIADVLKRSDDGLEAARPKGYSDRFLASWRNLIALCVAARSIGSFDYSISQLLQLDCNEITRRFIQEIWTVTQNLEGSAERSRGIARSARPFRSHAFVARCCQAVAAAFKIDGDNVVGRRPLPLGNFGKPIPPEYLIDRVDAELPMQPWKPGEHTRLAKQLNVKPGLVHAAIEILIARGRRLKQLDGVVFNTDGSIAASDTSRSSTQES